MKVKLRLWRMRKGWTQEQLAKASGITEQTINRIESKGIMPFPGTLKKLADGVEVSTEELLVEEEESRDFQKVG